MEEKGCAAVDAAKLLSFTIENYRSFYAPQTLDFANPDGSPRTLTCIYGPNSGGKSNSAYALRDFEACIVNSANASWRLPYRPFMLRKGATDRPTKFSASFVIGARRYEYSFSYDASHIVEEILKAESPKTGRLNLVFHRGEGGVDSKAASGNGFGKGLERKTRKETLLITKAHEDNNLYSEVVFGLVDATRVILDQGASLTPQFVEMLKGNEDLRGRILRLLRNCDFNIRDIAIGEAQIPAEAIDPLPLPIEVKQKIVSGSATTFSTLHAVRDDELTIVGLGAMDFWSNESNGTKKFFETAVPILDALDKGRTLYLDEYGTYLHHGLSRALIGLFTGEQNPNGARLIVNTQDTSLMSDVAGRDDIILVEKDMAEESRVSALRTRGARTTEPLESRYLRGLYGGVPLVRNRG